MLDFQRRTKGRTRAVSREQSRWVWLIFLVGVMLLFTEQAFRPETWQAIARLLAGAGPAGEDGPQGPPIDNRLDLAAPQTQGLALVAPPAPEGPPPSAPEQHALGGLTPEQLDSIQDDSPFRDAEHEAWLQLLGILRETDEAALERQSTGRVRYADLYRQSSAYRGQLVTVRGEARRAMPATAPKNPWAMERYFQVWVYPADNPSSPLQVYCLSLPRDFPTGMSVSQQVEVTGFYFKKSAYQAGDTLRTAPTLAAKTLRRLPLPAAPVEPEPPSMGRMLLVIVGVCVLGVGAAVVMYVRVRPRRRVELGGPVRFDNVIEPAPGAAGNGDAGDPPGTRLR